VRRCGFLRVTFKVRLTDDAEPRDFACRTDEGLVITLGVVDDVWIKQHQLITEIGGVVRVQLRPCLRCQFADSRLTQGVRGGRAREEHGDPDEYDECRC
jgi:hypothetical protein